jgi:putative membrane protein
MLLFVLLGIVVGILGVVPFLHTNLLLEILKNFFSDPLNLSIFAASLAFAHLVFEVLPSIFFYVPSANLNVSVLPSHQLVLKGEGLLAFKLTLHSFFFSLLLSVLLLPFFMAVLPAVFSFVKPMIPFLMLLLLAALFLSEKSPRKSFYGIAAFLISGVFGFAVFSLPLSGNTLFPVLTGLFGFSSLFLSIREESETIPQKDLPVEIDWRLIFVGALLGGFAVLFPAFNPALWSSLAFIFLENSPALFISLNSAVVSSKLFYDFAGVYIIGKARTGAAVVVKESLVGISLNQFVFIVLAILIAFSLSLAILLFLYKPVIKKIFSKKFRNPAPYLFVFLLVLLFIYSGFTGVFIASVATAVGLIPAFLGIKRSYSLGALILPSLIYATGLNLFLS